jgi:hypothetical protein
VREALQVTPEAAAHGLLQPGETIVWTGAPQGLLFLSRRQGAAVTFNLVWWLILLLIAASAWAMRDSPLVIVLMLIFLIGVIQDSWRTGRWLVRRIGETYALTDRRLLVIERSGKLRAEAGLLSAQGFHAAPPSGPRGAIMLGDDLPLWSATSGRRLKLNPDDDAPRLSGQIGHLALLDLIRRTAADYETRWAAKANAPED